MHNQHPDVVLGHLFCILLGASSLFHSDKFLNVVADVRLVAVHRPVYIALVFIGYAGICKSRK